MLYISPDVVPNTGSDNIIVGNSIREAIGGSNIDPIIPLYPSTYNIRVVGTGFETIFKINLTLAPEDVTVQAVDYII